MTAKPTINRSVPVGSSNKGPTVLPHVTVGNARQTASRHCPDQSKAWTLNKLDNLKIYTYNTRSIAEDHKLDQLLMELDNIKWQIVGISETHRMEEELIQLKVSNRK